MVRSQKLSQLRQLGACGVRVHSRHHESCRHWQTVQRSAPQGETNYPESLASGSKCLNWHDDHVGPPPRPKIGTNLPKQGKQPFAVGLPGKGPGKAHPTFPKSHQPHSPSTLIPQVPGRTERAPLRRRQRFDGCVLRLRSPVSLSPGLQNGAIPYLVPRNLEILGSQEEALPLLRQVRCSLSNGEPLCPFPRKSPHSSLR